MSDDRQKTNEEERIEVEENKISNAMQNIYTREKEMS